MSTILISSSLAIGTNGLVAYWSFDQANNRTDSISGLVLGQNKTPQHIAQGKLNWGYYFNASGDFLNLSTTVPSPGTNNISICAWYNTTNASRMGIATISTAATDWIYLEMGNNAPGEILSYIAFSTSANRNIKGNSGALNNGVWQFACLTYDYTGNINRIYSNATNKETFNNTAGAKSSIDTTQVYIGIGPNLGFRFQGKIDEVSIWNRVLTQSEISDLYNNGTGFNPTNTDVTAPGILSVCCTSPDPDDCTETYTTYDRTPTFSFTTNESATCKISSNNMTFSICSTTGATSQICTQPNKINWGGVSVYVNCTDVALNSVYDEFGMSITQNTMSVQIINPYNNMNSADNYTVIVYKAISELPLSNASFYINGVTNGSRETTVLNNTLQYSIRYFNEGVYQLAINVTDEQEYTATGYSNFTVDDMPWEVNGTVVLSKGALIVRRT